MPDKDFTEDFHFLEKKSDETGNEFLQQRLIYLQEHFSYSELSGLSAGELERQYELFRLMVRKTKGRYANSDFVFSDELGVYESIIGEFIPSDWPSRRFGGSTSVNLLSFRREHT